MSVEVKLELGHKAILREKKTIEGFTHDWTVFVKGCEGSNIFHFVDKVVFHLHDSFPKPKRVVKEPPYQVSECGYAGFIMPIEVYFRSKEEPKKVKFEYDLYLRLEGEPVHNIRLEKLTFQNPSDDFRRKLLKARSDRLQSSGIVGAAGLPHLAVGPPQHSEESRLQVVHHKTTPAIAEKKQKPLSTSKESLQSNHQKPNSKVGQPITPTPSIARKEPKPVPKDNLPSDTKPKASKVEKDSSKPASVKRPQPTSGDSASNPPRALPEKRRKVRSGLKSNDSVPKQKDEKKDKHKVLKSHSGTNSSKKDRHKNGKSPSSVNNNHKVVDEQDSGSGRGSESSSDPSSKAASASPEGSYREEAMSPNDDESMSSMSSGDDDVGDDHAIANNVPKSKANFKVDTKSKVAKSPLLAKKHDEKQNGSCKDELPSPMVESKTLSSSSSCNRQELIELQTRIMETADHQQLQRIVDLIEKTGKFQITTKSFDFDLCSLDQSTILQLKSCVKMS